MMHLRMQRLYDFRSYAAARRVQACEGRQIGLRKAKAASIAQLMAIGANGRNQRGLLWVIFPGLRVAWRRSM